MRQFERQIWIQASLKECCRLWLAFDHYPRFTFSEVPELPENWSSSDAWGENCISGNRHLHWSVTSYPGADRKQIDWRIQDKIKSCLIQLSGSV